MDVKLPQLAEGVESGTVVSILVSAGQEVKKDQPIMELETQKAVGSIPSPASGTVTKIHVKEGMEVAVGQTLLSIATDLGATGPASQSAKPAAATAPQARDERPTAGQPTTEPSQPTTDTYHYESKSGAPPPAAPSIRKIARDLGIDLTRVKGSESGGRIVMEDLRAYVQRLQQIAFRESAETVSSVPTTAKPRQADTVDFAKWGPIRREKMSSLRRIVSQRMVQSWTTIPKINQFADADISALLALRKKFTAAYDKKLAHLTLTPFILRAVSNALKKYPRANSSLDEATQEIIFKDYCHIGIAVDTDAGLIVPVLRDVDKKNLLELSRELNELTEKTRQRKISVDELQGGTFTISNQGSIGGSHFTPIIYAPQVAILGVGQGGPKAVVMDEKIVIRTLLPLCLAYDHRVLDGADAVRFLKEIIAGLESFDEKDMKIS
jgi:pyruvate dehydrogenase E2 component (dihydrolipoamide acetyltransferase)